MTYTKTVQSRVARNTNIK